MFGESSSASASAVSRFRSMPKIARCCASISAMPVSRSGPKVSDTAVLPLAPSRRYDGAEGIAKPACRGQVACDERPRDGQWMGQWALTVGVDFDLGLGLALAGQTRTKSKSKFRCRGG